MILVDKPVLVEAGTIFESGILTDVIYSPLIEFSLEQIGLSKTLEELENEF